MGFIFTYICIEHYTVLAYLYIYLLSSCISSVVCFCLSRFYVFFHLIISKLRRIFGLTTHQRVAGIFCPVTRKKVTFTVLSKNKKKLSQSSCSDEVPHFSASPSMVRNCAKIDLRDEKIAWSRIYDRLRVTSIIANER